MRADSPERPDGPGHVPDFVPDDRFVDAVRAGVARHRRRTRRRATAGLALCALLAGSGVWWANERLSGVQRVEMGTSPVTDPLDTGEPFNVLVLGLDCCAPAKDAPMADTIAVVHIDPTAHRIDLVNLPRDLVLDPDRPRKLNSLGIAGIRDTLATDLGISTEHVAVVDYAGFESLATLLDPRLNVGVSLRDRTSGLSLSAGCRAIGPQQWLALVRSRHLEWSEPDGRWVADPTGDLGRVGRQQAVARVFLDRLRSMDLGPGDLERLVDAAEGAVAVDDGTSNLDLVRLAQLFRSSNLGTVVALPVEAGGDSTMSYLTLVPGLGLTEALRPFTDGRTPPLAMEGPSPSTPNGSPAPTSIGWADLGSC